MAEEPHSLSFFCPSACLSVCLFKKSATPRRLPFSLGLALAHLLIKQWEGGANHPNCDLLCAMSWDLAAESQPSVRVYVPVGRWPHARTHTPTHLQTQCYGEIKCAICSPLPQAFIWEFAQDEIIKLPLEYLLFELSSSTKIYWPFAKYQLILWSRASPPQHYWHFWLDNYFRGLCVVGEGQICPGSCGWSAASLTYAH